MDNVVSGKRHAAFSRLVHSMLLGRRIALLGGTTQASDLKVALRYFATPGQFVQGPEIRAYEDAFARKIGVRYAFSFSSGRVGLYGLLRLMGVGDGDDVLLQVPTHIVVANAIRYAGARPVYVDCRLEDYNMDLDEAAKKITSRTRVMLLQHTFGIPTDMEKALYLAKQHKLTIIEDCVHALGARYNGRQVGGFGRAAFFSTEETKTISTTMGGMVVTDDPELAEQLRLFQASCPLPSYWKTAKFVLKLMLYHLLMEPHLHRYSRSFYEMIGRRHPLPRPTTDEELRGQRPSIYEERLSNVQAALGLLQLERLEENLNHRNKIASLYEKGLIEMGYNGPRSPESAEPSYVRYPVWVRDKEAAVNTLAGRIVVGTWFTSVLEEALSPEYGEYESGSCPRAEEVARHLINLPTHARVAEGDAEALVAELQGMIANPKEQIIRKGWGGYEN